MKPAVAACPACPVRANRPRKGAAQLKQYERWMPIGKVESNRPRKGAAQLKLVLLVKVRLVAGANRPRKGAAQLKPAASTPITPAASILTAPERGRHN